jgi:hypothetical protein
VGVGVELQLMQEQRHRSAFVEAQERGVGVVGVGGGRAHARRSAVFSRLTCAQRSDKQQNRTRISTQANSTKKKNKN